MIQEIATVAVYVDDQEKALRFWTEQVGFEVRTDHQMAPNARWIEVGPKGGQSRLVLYPKAMMKGWEKMAASIVFQCDDVFKTYEEMKARGVKFESEPHKMEWGTYVAFEDVDGNEFLLKG